MRKLTRFQEGAAIFDRSGLYRYSLRRRWDSRRGGVCFVLLNPSTADASRDDPTIRRCRGFARDWGYGSFEVVNLFAYRATHTAELRRARDPVGQDADRYILEAVARSDGVVLGWGNHGALLGRDREVLDLLIERDLFCFGMTKQNQPRHPLYVPSWREPICFQDEWRSYGGQTA